MLAVDRKTVAKCKNCGNIQSNKAARMRTHFPSYIKKVTNECEDVEASSSSERPAEADLNRIKGVWIQSFMKMTSHSLSMKKQCFNWAI